MRYFIEMNTKELFEFLTLTKGWNNGYCEDAQGRLLKHRHKKGTLTFETYEKLFKHFGYSQNISWTFTDKI